VGGHFLLLPTLLRGSSLAAFSGKRGPPRTIFYTTERNYMAKIVLPAAKRLKPGAKPPLPPKLNKKAKPKLKPKKRARK